ncbi:MAG: hypothetical protein ABJB39_00330 [Chloroflexota bacterium]
MRRLILIPALATILALGGAPIAVFAATATPEATNPAPRPSGNLVVPIDQIVGSNAIDAVATITNVSVVNGVLTAAGTITGTITNTVTGAVTTFTTTFTAPLTVVSATCDILTLNLGAIHLDLLGLVVDTSPIDVLITAVAAPGNLLGNLLCAVVHLLDGSAPLGSLAALLNNILSIL